MRVQGMLGAFVDFIKERKTVALEDLAAQFGLRVQVCYPACSDKKDTSTCRIVKTAVAWC